MLLQDKASLSFVIIWYLEFQIMRLDPSVSNWIVGAGFLGLSVTKRVQEL